jgi:hypothetical protein
MSGSDDLATNLGAALCASFVLHEVETGKFVLQTPFQFEDGDGYPVVMERHEKGWRITDQGGGASHLTLDDVDFTPARLEMLVDIAEGSGFDFEDLVLSRIQSELPTPFDVADVIQAIAQLSAIRFISRERVRRLYRDDVAKFVEAQIPSQYRDLRWSPPKDARGLYAADALLRSSDPDLSPTTLFAVGNAEQAEHVTISILMHKQWGLEVDPLVVYDRQVRNRIGSPRIFHLQDAAGDQAVIPVASGDWRPVERILKERRVPVAV